MAASFMDLVVEDGTGVPGATSYVSGDYVKSQVGALLPEGVDDSALTLAILHAHLELKGYLGVNLEFRTDSLYLTHPTTRGEAVPAAFMQAAALLTLVQVLMGSTAYTDAKTVAVDGLFSITMDSKAVSPTGRTIATLMGQARALLNPYRQPSPIAMGHYYYV